MCNAGLRTRVLLHGGDDWHIEPMRFAPPPASLTAPAIHSSSQDRLHRIGGTPPPSRRSQFEKPVAPPPAAGFSDSGFRLVWAGAAIGTLNSVQPANAASGLARTCIGRRDLHHERLADPADGVALGLNVPGSLRDIVVVRIDDNPASLEIGKTGTPALNGGNLQAIRSACGGCVAMARSARWVRPSAAPRTATTTQVGRVLRPSDSPRSFCQAQRYGYVMT